ncbi:hypothetical protein STCU_06081 [Strigomonas culicis]|uniref:Uncharacterized protein n=1 Tax=Strigomonas culicis TaxID=28005 RepID=S9UCX6_9TRYP|nr:hypothetical protein STCU_06081 [Strigomonas culicis]|eukprot:EPY26783.1 hypothetical protein STCU_06081 [Strigomonas culicis]
MNEKSAALLSNESGGLLFCNNQDHVEPLHATFAAAASRPPHVPMTTKTEKGTFFHTLLSAAAALAWRPLNTEAQQTHFHVQLNVPPDLFERTATTAAPVQLKDGMLYPVVPFAVGAAHSSSGSAAAGAPPEMAEMSCLAHVQLDMRVAEPQPQQQVKNKTLPSPLLPDPSDDTKRAATQQPPLDPWQLGVALDPFEVATAHTYAARGAFDRRVAVSAAAAAAAHGYVVFGRPDAEVYLLPQRELLLTFFHTATLEREVAEQNAARRVTQHKVGLAAAAAAAPEARRPPMWFTDEVRALPGDVVFVPHSFGVRVQRIAKVDVVLKSTDSTAQRPPSPSPPTPRQQQQQQQELEVSTDAMGASPPLDVAITSVEVDAVLHTKKKYPVLSVAESKLYLAANFHKQRAVTDFYQKGGKMVFTQFT